MDLHLRDKAVVVTGASAGIGYATAKAFAQEGARVVAASRNTASLEELERHFPIVRVNVGLSTPDGPESLRERTLQAFGRVDVLVNNAGIFEARQGFLSVSDEDWHRTWEINFMSAVRICRAALPAMIKQGQGAIINIASESARQPDIFLVDYSVSKAALLMLSKALAIEFGPKASA
jgi:NAD(P)-dependent dehydrogenase (short-subunit alcohol dehydrogenase family)